MWELGGYRCTGVRTKLSFSQMLTVNNLPSPTPHSRNYHHMKGATTPKPTPLSQGQAGFNDWSIPGFKAHPFASQLQGARDINWGHCCTCFPPQLPLCLTPLPEHPQGAVSKSTPVGKSPSQSVSQGIHPKTVALGIELTSTVSTFLIWW